MHAIIIDENKFIQSHSDKFRTPESILVDSIPDVEDPEKIFCYQYIEGEFIFNADKWAEIEAFRAEQEAARIKAEEEAAEAERIAEIECEIDALKAEISASDYKIIKCYEYAMNGLDLPYDAAELHESRQALRNKINEREKELILQEDKE